MTNEQTTSNRPLLKVRGLKKYFPVRRGFLQRTKAWVKAVDGVDFEITKGQTLGLVGESGCGKSTVARLALRLLDPDSGYILYEGVDITRLSEKDMKPIRKQMQIVFQDPFGSLNPRMTIGQTVEEGLRVAGIRDRAERKERVSALLQMAGLSPEVADRYPHEFSGGQRQRVGIARALSVQPSLVLCDEPVSALDVSIQAQILNLLKELQEKLGLTYLFISHDLNVVGYMSDWVAVMYLGHIMEYAPAEELFVRPLHPYTKALFDAAPKPGQQVELKPLSGDVPSPIDPPPGCKFQGRCPLVEARCGREEIDLVEIDTNHFVRCWKVAGT
ncbi:MAG: ABC transporter ATP-binding protein [Deltaproteobacteria bacterium]|nr:ABC transporter ATP-binding protein [Deltaproteobacteria bacterium]MBW1930296.1 ABC transporter ATP-binding protein [Deltaproteobacteria bacterium]